jgi:hypothetical protein
VLRWVERGGPPLDAPPVAKGFGITLLQNTVIRPFSGVLECEWRRQGLAVTITLPSKVYRTEPRLLDCWSVLTSALLCRNSDRSRNQAPQQLRHPGDQPVHVQGFRRRTPSPRMRATASVVLSYRIERPDRQIETSMVLANPQLGQ